MTFYNLSVNQIGTLVNLVCLLIPLGFSVGIGRLFPRPYFQSWMLGLTTGGISLTFEFYTIDQRHPLFPTMFACLAFVLCGWFHFRTASSLHNIRGWDSRMLWLSLATWVGYVAAARAGIPFEQGFLPAVLLFVGTLLYMAWTLATCNLVGKTLRTAVGILIGLQGGCILLYPALINTNYMLAGYLGSGVLHLLSGIGMLLFLLSDLSSNLQSKNEALQTLDRLQTEFLGNMNHELRTPLQAIKTAAFLLGGGPDQTRLSEQQRTAVEILEANADRLNGLVTDVVDFSKLASGTMRYELLPTDLNALVSGAAGSLQQMFQAGAVDLTLDLPDTSVGAEVDARRIEQVIINLLANARKFTPSGGQVVVRLREDGPNARIEVMDTGIGIPTAELEHIFMRFYQVDGTTTRQVGGNGLGLSICKAIVEDGHRGRIWAESNGSGSTFVVLLPLEVVAEQPNESKSTSSAPIAP